MFHKNEDISIMTLRILCIFGIVLAIWSIFWLYPGFSRVLEVTNGFLKIESLPKFLSLDIFEYIAPDGSMQRSVSYKSKVINGENLILRVSSDILEKRKLIHRDVSLQRNWDASVDASPHDYEAGVVFFTLETGDTIFFKDEKYREYWGICFITWANDPRWASRHKEFKNNKKNIKKIQKVIPTKMGMVTKKGIVTEEIPVGDAKVFQEILSELDNLKVEDFNK